MPEGPETRRAAEQIAEVIQNKVIEDIDVGLPHLIAPSKKLKGVKVEEVESRGKAMLIHFANGLSIYSHNQLYGVWKTAKRSELPKTKRSLRLALHTEDRSALLYSASEIAVYERGELLHHPFLSKIGPDVLDSELSWQDVAERLQHKRFHNRGLSTLYLDQHFIAGIGNYLRTEILFAAGVHPDYKPKQLSEKQIEALAKETLEVGKCAYETDGHTLRPELRSKLLEADGCYDSVRFMAFNREGLPCRDCVMPIIKAQRNGRRIYWCEICQPYDSHK